jgi:nicotinate-nucleotide pyrophosphorylase (carboxylating)
MKAFGPFSKVVFWVVRDMQDSYGASTLGKEFHQVRWDASLHDEAVALLRLAIREDLGPLGDSTSKALIPKSALGAAALVARGAGIVAGIPVAEAAAQLIDPSIKWVQGLAEGETVKCGDPIARMEGPARSILAAERLLLNVLGRLSGVATTTQKYVDAVAGTRARIYDTRKTTPGWRRLEKYAVHLGGGYNHRTGLFDAILIKDNHLAFGRVGTASARFSPAQAVAQARQWIKRRVPQLVRSRMIVEIEVDALAQLAEVLSADPDIVLLDNMTPRQLAEAVTLRDTANPVVELEASGGVTLECVREIAESGVDRISVGALTHSARSLDVGLDWLGG